jgi:hypothetical protein
MSTSFSERFGFGQFLQWHAEATERLQDGESLATPTLKFFEQWRSNRLQEAINHALFSSTPDATEGAILVDLREATRKIRRGDTFESIEERLRSTYAGNNPYLAGPVSVDLI